MKKILFGLLTIFSLSAYSQQIESTQTTTFYVDGITAESSKLFVTVGLILIDLETDNFYANVSFTTASGASLGGVRLDLGIQDNSQPRR